MKELMLGAISMACFVVGLFFMRFWKSTRDLFFLLFGIAFWVESVNRILLVFLNPSEEFPVHYLIRLFTFSLILFAIINKNLSKD